MSLTKTADPDKYGYRDYESKKFDTDSKFPLLDVSWGKMSSFLELKIVVL